MKELINRLEELSRQAKESGGDARIERQHPAGKLIAHERIDLLLEKGLLTELDKLVIYRRTDFGMEKQKIPGDGAVTGYGVISKRLIYAFAQGFIVFDGALSETRAEKICKVMGMTMRMGALIIGLNDSGEVRIQEGVCSLAGYVEIFLHNSLVSGVTPQISAIMGSCVGRAVYSPVSTDLILMVKNSSYMFTTGSNVVKSVTQEEINKEDLRGADVRIMESGVARLPVENDTECINYIRGLISCLPGNNMGGPPFVATADPSTRLASELSGLVPTSLNQSHGIKETTHAVADDNSFFELQEEFVRNAVIDYTRLNRKTIGVVVNQPLVLAGAFGISAPIKAAHSVRLRDAFNIPLFTLVDVPGFLPGMDQEYGGIIRNDAKSFYTYYETTVSKMTAITRKAYDGAYDVMSSRYIRGDISLTYPTVEIAVMGLDGAVSILSRKEIGKVADAEAKGKELQDDYRSKFINPYRAVELDYVDEVIGPAVTCIRLIRSFEMLANKRQLNPSKKHSNLPF